VDADRDDDLAEALEAARTAHHLAYAEARRVLDQLPAGGLDEASTDAERQGVVRRWQAAEAEYDRLRRRSYGQAE
jgi:hypothetical protein